MAGHNPRCREEAVQEAKGAVGDLVCQAFTGQKASQEAQDQEQRRHCTAITLAAQEQPKYQMRIDTANVARCIMILLLMMMKTPKPLPTPVMRQIWKAAIKNYLCLIGWAHCFMIVIGW
jgi:hypothetical protein